MAGMGVLPQNNFRRLREKGGPFIGQNGRENGIVQATLQPLFVMPVLE